MTKAQIIDKYIQRIMVDYPEADKIHIDLVQFAEELRQTDVSGALPLAQIEELLNSLTDDQRLSLIGSYCHGCGSTDKNCQCWNDD